MKVWRALPSLVGFLVAATLITVGALPLLGPARAEVPAPAPRPSATPAPVVVPPAPTPAATAPISEAEKRASSTGFKKPLRDLGTCEMRFSAVGASFTQANSPGGDAGSPMLDGRVGDGSWAYWANEDPQLLLDGGWALGGQETGDIAERVRRSWFPVDTNLVILLGTNNLLHGTPIDQAPADIEKIVRVSGISPDRIYLVELPPSDVTPDLIDPYNAMLADTARANGYHLVDVSTFLNNGDGAYRAGATVDGIHLTKENAQLVGRSIAAAINANSGCRRLPAFDAAAAEHELGDPVDVPRCDLPDGGCVQLFERGALRRSNDEAPTLLPEPITAAWRAFGVPALGYPTEDPVCGPPDGLPDGACRTRFEHGTMYSRGADAWVVRGDILTAYREQQGPAGRLGLPTGNEQCTAEGCTQRFDGGTIGWTAATGARVL